MLSAAWVLITVGIAVLLWVSTKLIYTAGFFLMLGVTGALMLHSKWVYGIISLGFAGVILIGAFYFEPGWYNSLLEVLSSLTM